MDTLNQAALQAYFYPGNDRVNALADRLAHGTHSTEDYKKLLRGLGSGEFLYADSEGRPVINRVPGGEKEAQDAS